MSASRAPVIGPVVPVFRAAALRGWPDHPEGGAADYRVLAGALRATWACDAHFAAYSVPAVPRRLTKRALDPARLPDGVRMVAWIVDVDDPAAHAHNAPIKRARSHLARATAAGAPAPDELVVLASAPTVAASSAWREDFAARVARLRADHPALGAYETRGGGRILAWLEAPTVLRSAEDARAWAAWHALSLAWLARVYGIESDPLTREWGRVFRLPHATRDGGASPEAWTVHALPSAPWSFTPCDEDREALRALAAAGEAERAEHNGRNLWGEALRDAEPAPVLAPVRREGAATEGAAQETTRAPRAQGASAPRAQETTHAARVASTGNGRAWIDASAHHPCPVCGGVTWCGIARDGATVLCKRVESGRTRITRDGVEVHVHHLAPAPARPHRVEPLPVTRARADEDTRDRAYRAVLAALRLDAADHDALLARGLSAEDITANGYRSLHLEGRARLACAIVEAVGEDLAGAVPGVVRRERLSLAGCPGVIVPCRDARGRIVALKVRRRDPCDGPRYLYLSSARDGGASAASVLHVPVRARAMLAASSPPRRVFITEGELKADVASALAGLPVLSIPGVGSWRMALEAARALRPAVVCVALDMDAAGARAAEQLVNALRAEGRRAELWRWRRFKGLDDVLAAGRRGNGTV